MRKDTPRDLCCITPRSFQTSTPHCLFLTLSVCWDDLFSFASMPRYHTLTYLLREGRLTVIHGLIDEKYERRGCAVFCLCVECCCWFLSRFPQGRFTRELCIALEMGAHVSLIMIPSVHWCNTSELLSELIKNLKPHEAQYVFVLTHHLQRSSQSRAACIRRSGTAFVRTAPA